ncbi:hypothetical protein [Stackebrandtia nassauensis]|uniref:DUF4878 domain-containing protein n=1 Tax=Stackebrandtia nassauensis (strain DSM 44728 / CIP 108903 / NRRL B-16338 / NBRC 102104 / LLR-40K-21) TaxID=446470 RepID=D3Q0L5_STANL|nr:hypothetical protein [Stackebrandtia nassauensis]ADD41751.1 hypothetical protein Snas_2057 [Stackebrandtia nassauensis DSM 44728]
MTSHPQSPAPMPGQQSPVQAMSPRSPAGPTSTVPVPPRGPGVVVPFAAPPRDPDKSRLAVGIVVGVVAFVLVCGGAVAGAVGVLVWSSNELAAQSTQTAERFLDDIVEEDYQGAYKSLCSSTRKQISVEEFTKDWSSLGVVNAETVGANTSQQQDLVVVAELTVEDGSMQDIELTVALEQQNMKMAVCGWDTVQ